MGYGDLHKQLVRTHIPNRVGCQYDIPTDMNIPILHKVLKRNKEHQLIYFLKYGFPLDIPQSPEFEPNTVVTNQ